MASLSVNTTIKYNGAVRQSAATTSILTVPAGNFFKGTITAFYNASGSGYSGLLNMRTILRDTNSSGVILAMNTNMSSPYNSYALSGTIPFSSCQNVELPEGTYHLSGLFDSYIVGGAGTPFQAAATTVAFLGSFYTNTP